MPFEAVTFDLWETLIADSPQQNDRRAAHRVEKIGELLSGAGRPLPSAELERAHAGIWDECSRSWERAVDLPFEQQVSRFLDLASPGLSSSVDMDTMGQISDVYASAALLFPPSPVSGAVKAVSELKARGLKVGLICNTGRTPGSALRRLLSDFGLLPLLDAAFFSDETIVRKPDARIFRLALESLGAAVERSVHVGDSLENDVRGSLGAGMRAVWISRDIPPGEAPAPVAGSVAEVPKLTAGW